MMTIIIIIIINKFGSSLKKSFNDKDIMIIFISFIFVIFWLVPSSWVSFTPLYPTSLSVFLPLCLTHTRTYECMLSFIFNKLCVNYIYSAQQFYLNCLFISLIISFWLYWPNVLQMTSCHLHRISVIFLLLKSISTTDMGAFISPLSHTILSTMPDTFQFLGVLAKLQKATFNFSTSALPPGSTLLHMDGSKIC